MDANQILKHYTTDKLVNFTKTMLWDMEKKKAWNLEEYIPYAVRQGSAQSWGKQQSSINTDELFVRSSQQKQWLHPDIYEEVYEEVYVNNKILTIIFLGIKTVQDRSEIFTPKQALLHVQHGAGGTEEHPANKWRIVHLTPKKDMQLIIHFKKI